MHTAAITIENRAANPVNTSDAALATSSTFSVVTPSDSTSLDSLTSKGLWVGGAGTLQLRGIGSSTTVAFIVSVGGTYVPVHVSRVMAATTATGIVALS